MRQINTDDLNNDPENYVWGIFYFNPKDTRTILPKRNKLMGWTINFANPLSYLLLCSIVIVGYIVAKIAVIAQ